jgi:hypothetical protein
LKLLITFSQKPQQIWKVCSWEIREETNYEDSDTEYLAEVYDFNKALYDNLKQIKSIVESNK